MTRDEAVKRLKVYRDYLCKMSSWFDVNEVAKPFNMAIDALERKRGKWIIREPKDLHSTCSCCGFYNAINPYYKYCPNCGSDMRGDTDEQIH